MKPFWTIRAAADDDSTGEIYIYGIIEGDPAWFEDETTPMTFLNDLKEIGDVDRLDIRINSPGGNVFAGNAIYSILRRQSAQKVVTVDGLAASAASVVAMAGDEVVMPVNAMMMIHNPWGLSMGFAYDHRKMAEELDKIGETLVATYKDKTGLRPSKIRNMMADETWMTANEAKENGFADRVDDRKVEASVGKKGLVVNGEVIDLSKYRNAPPVERFVSDGARQKQEEEPDPMSESDRKWHAKMRARYVGGD